MRPYMRAIVCCFLLLIVGFSAQAQWFQVRSSAPSTALRLFSYQQVDFGESGVSADNSLDYRASTGCSISTSYLFSEKISN
jgi:hypothetical protein